jgi:hypothetical protein
MMMLVHHDDATREFSYGAESKIGTFSDALMAEAKAKNWNVISMKDDWKKIFAFEKLFLIEITAGGSRGPPGHFDPCWCRWRLVPVAWCRIPEREIEINILRFNVWANGIIQKEATSHISSERHQNHCRNHPVHRLFGDRIHHLESRPSGVLSCGQIIRGHGCVGL